MSIRIEDLVHELKTAHADLEALRDKELKVIKEEVKKLHKLVDMLFPFATKKEINGEEALLIYVFAVEKEWISTEAYLTKSGKVTYQVYDENKYRGYVPGADIRFGFVSMTAERFLENVPLSEILEFFLDRPNVLMEYAQEKSEKTRKREMLLSKLKGVL